MEAISVIGCGWLGLPLALQFLQDGYLVRGSTTSAEKLTALQQVGIEAYLLRVTQDELQGATAALLSSDTLILNIPPGRRQPDVLNRYPAQIRLLVDAARRRALSRLLFVSSTGVYADVNQVVTEEDKVWAEQGSGAALVQCEQYLREIDGLSVSILRLGGLVGGERKAGRFLAGKKEVANGNAPVNMLHREDAVGVIRAVLQQDAWGETFNVCADAHPTRAAFYTAQAEKQGFEPPTFQPDGKLSYKIVSNQKVKERLGYTFRYPDPLQF